MRYNKKLEIRLSNKLKRTIKFYYGKDFSSKIRELIIIHLEVLSRNVEPEIADFYETVKPRMPEYFEYAKSIGFDDSDFEKKHKETKISSLKFINKLYEELQWRDKVESDLNDIIKELKTKLKQNENSTR